MSRRSSFKLLTDVDKHYEALATETVSVEDIVWSSCFICQEDSSDKVICPAHNSKQEVDVEEKYKRLLNEVRRLETLEILCPSLKRRLQLDEIEKKCNEKRAVYHKKCRNRYDNQHFERANKRQKLSAEAGNSSSSTPSTKTRSHFQAQNFQKKCFLCGAVTKESLHQVQTFKLDQHVRDAAERLMDEELLAKLSEGDLVATEACYHSTCLTTLYNKVSIMYVYVRKCNGNCYNLDTRN